jgi:predicted 2-oxoglutarate/Fe(II)-dependent dioxygenase YbiX
MIIREEELIFKSTSVIIWPSNFLFPHCVEPIQEGVRYSIVAWA